MEQRISSFNKISKSGICFVRRKGLASYWRQAKWSNYCRIFS